MSDPIEILETLTPTEMIEQLECNCPRPDQIAHISESESPMWESWDLAKALHLVFPMIETGNENDETDMRIAFDTLMGYYDELRAHGFRTPEHIWRDRLRAVLPFAQRDVDELAKLAESRAELEETAQKRAVVEYVFNEVNRFEVETRGEGFDTLISRLVPLHLR